MHTWAGVKHANTSELDVGAHLCLCACSCAWVKELVSSWFALNTSLSAISSIELVLNANAECISRKNSTSILTDVFVCFTTCSRAPFLAQVADQAAAKRPLAVAFFQMALCLPHMQTTRDASGALFQSTQHRSQSVLHGSIQSSMWMLCRCINASMHPARVHCWFMSFLDPIHQTRLLLCLQAMRWCSLCQMRAPHTPASLPLGHQTRPCQHQ
jgi:hypothetical protein